MLHRRCDFAFRFVFLCVSLENLAKLSHSHENVWLRQRNPLIFPIFQALNGAKTVKSRQRNSVRRANKPPCTGIGAQLRDGQVLKSSSRDPYLPLCEVSSPPSEVAYPENKKHPTDFSSRTNSRHPPLWSQWAIEFHGRLSHLLRGQCHPSGSRVTSARHDWW